MSTEGFAGSRVLRTSGITAGTTVITGRARLVRMIVAGGTAGAVSIYDDVDSNDVTKRIFGRTVVVGDSYLFDCPMTEGIRVELPTAVDIVLVYSED